MDRLSKSINIGVADIFAYSEGSDIPVYLGITKEGVTFKYEPKYHELTSDQTGSTPLDDVLIGENASAEVKILDTSKRKIALIIPTATAEGSAESPTAVTFGQRPGFRASAKFVKLRLHPISAGDSLDYDVIIYRTTNTGSLELAFKLEEEWVIPCIFKAYYDDFRQPGDQLFRIGTESENEDVYKRVILFWITPSNPSVKVGETVSFRANAMYEDGSQEDVTDKCTWVSSSTEKVTLSGTTVKTATAVAAGSVVIRAEYVGYSNSTSMVVNAIA
jgi:hypothetical protein